MKPMPSQHFGSVSRCLAVAGALAMAAPLPTAPGQDGGRRTPLQPPGASFLGRSADDWNVLASQTSIETHLGGQDRSDSIDGMRLLLESFDPGRFEFDVHLDVPIGVVSPPFFLYGERYDDGTHDDPVELADLLQFIFETTYIETRFDGKLMLQGFASELTAYQFGPTYFDQPIEYEHPIPRGENLNAVAALWTMGIGSVYFPLSPGRHTLSYVMRSDFFGGFEYTYNITVGRPTSRPGDGPFVDVK